MIEFDESRKQELVTKLQQYFDTELQHEIGSFEAQFLLDFISEKIGSHYYNQGLSDALKAFDTKLEEVNELLYQLEKDVD